MKKVVVIGGGTGSFSVLHSLKGFPLELIAIVSMADDGGSSGVLRKELGVAPPGDVRQCLVALAHASEPALSLINYRFKAGGLEGHSLGNILLAALEQITGSMELAIEEFSRLFAVHGQVVPVTQNAPSLKMILRNLKVLAGEREIYGSQEICGDYEKLYLEPEPKVNPKALDVIAKADLVVVGPGGFYTSILPIFLVPGIGKALQSSCAKKMFIVNLVNRKGQTSGFTVSRYLKELARYCDGNDIFDYILVNKECPQAANASLYAEEGDFVRNDLSGDARIIEAPLLGPLEPQTSLLPEESPLYLKRSRIRHSEKKLALELLQVVNSL